MNLSAGFTFAYVLHGSGCAGRLCAGRGRLCAGRIERHDSHGVRLYNAEGEFIEYISGSNLRSWCVLGPLGDSLEEWSHVLPQDVFLIQGTTTSTHALN